MITYRWSLERSKNYSEQAKITAHELKACNEVINGVIVKTSELLATLCQINPPFRDCNQFEIHHHKPKTIRI